MSGLWIEVLVSYDISENKNRSKFYNFLLDMGLNPIQKSLFWGKILQPELKDIKDRIKLGYLKIDVEDKILITKVSIVNEQTFTLGHRQDDFIKKEFKIV